MSAVDGGLQTKRPTLMRAWRGEGNLQRPRLPDQVFIFASKPTFPPFAFSFAELDDNLAAGVLILVVGIGVDLTHELVDTLFDKSLEVDVLDPGYRDVQHIVRRGLEVGKNAIPEDCVKNGSDDVFGVGLVGKDVDAERSDSAFFHAAAEGIGYCLVHVARKSAGWNLSMSLSQRHSPAVDDDWLL